MIYSPYWQEIRPYVTHGDDGYHQLAKNAPKDIEEKLKERHKKECNKKVQNIRGDY